MNTSDRTVLDLMVSLDEYAVVPKDATLLDALHALDRTGAGNTNNGHRHRAVLVRDTATGRIVGKIGHHAFLQAIRRTRDRIACDPRLDRAGVNQEMMQRSESVYRLFSDDVSDLCARARMMNVCEAMHPVSERIPENTSLLEALDAFDRWHTLSILVTRNDRAVGILRLVDLFDEVAATMKRCADNEGGR